MTLDELYDYMERDTPILSTSDMPNDIRAMLLFRTLAPDSTKHRVIGAAEHDIVYVNADLEEVANNATTTDLDILLACGVFLNEDRFAIYV